MAAARGKILYVDDDADLLAGVRRQLRTQFDLDTADVPTEAIARLREAGPYSVIVSDLRMPGMDGFEVLRQAQTIAPEVTRILLTGQADLATAKRAVNEGHVFRFLTKPCPSDELAAALRAGIELHDLKIAERDLLERTLRGAVQVLVDVLGLVNPAAFGRASRVSRYVNAIVEAMSLPDAWRYEIAAMLSQIGCVTVPPAMIDKLNAGEPLGLDETRMLDETPLTAHKLLSGIPRLEEVAEMVRDQGQRYRSAAGPRHRAGKDIPLGARILKVALDLDRLEKREGSRGAALTLMTGTKECYDPEVMEAAALALGAPAPVTEQEIELEALEPGMIVVDEIRTVDGLLLVSAGQCVNVGMLDRLRNWMRRSERSLPPRVRIVREGR